MKIVVSTNGYPLLLEAVCPLSRIMHLAKIGVPNRGRLEWFEKIRREFPLPSAPD